MRSVALGVPRLIWVAAMAVVVAAAAALVAARSAPSETRPAEAAAAAVEAPADLGTGVLDDGGAVSTRQAATSVAGTELDGTGTTGSTGSTRSTGSTGSTDTAGEGVETTTTATSRERLDPTTTGTTLQPVDICDTTPPLTADPSCPGYQTATLPTTRSVISGTVFNGSLPPTVTAAPTVTTDVCDPNAVSTTHPSCVGDPYFCGSVTTIPTCPARPPGG